MSPTIRRRRRRRRTAERYFARLVCPHERIPPKLRFLEVGAEKNHHVFFRAKADPEWATMGLGKKTAPTVLADANDCWPFKAGSFELFYCSHVLEHVDSPSRFMREAWRILIPGGWVRFAVPDAQFYIRRYMGEIVSLDECMKGLRTLEENCPGGHRNPFDVPKLELLLQGSGFRRITFPRSGRSKIRRFRRDRYFSTRRNRTIYVEAQKESP